MVGGWWLVAVGGGWWRWAVGGGWWLVAVGGWWLAGGGPWGLSLTTNRGFLRTALRARWRGGLAWRGGGGATQHVTAPRGCTADLVQQAVDLRARVRHPPEVGKQRQVLPPRELVPEDVMLRADPHGLADRRQVRAHRPPADERLAEGAGEQPREHVDGRGLACAMEEGAELKPGGSRAWGPQAGGLLFRRGWVQGGGGEPQPLYPPSPLHPLQPL